MAIVIGKSASSNILAASSSLEFSSRSGMRSSNVSGVMETGLTNSRHQIILKLIKVWKMINKIVN